jgi:hypothetical protein
MYGMPLGGNDREVEIGKLILNAKTDAENKYNNKNPILILEILK